MPNGENEGECFNSQAFSYPEDRVITWLMTATSCNMNVCSKTSDSADYFFPFIYGILNTQLLPNVPSRINNAAFN